MEVFRDSGHFITCDALQALRFPLGWKFSTNGFCALKTHHWQRGSAVPILPAKQEERQLLGTLGWSLAIVLPLWHRQSRAFPGLTTALLMGHRHGAGQELAFLRTEEWLCIKPSLLIAFPEHLKSGWGRRSAPCYLSPQRALGTVKMPLGWVGCRHRAGWPSSPLHVPSVISAPFPGLRGHPQPRRWLGLDPQMLPRRIRFLLHLSLFGVF